ncbi:hypothetical protein [Streptomyces sp. NBC_01276]
MNMVLAARVIERSGPAPFHVVPVPEEQSADVRQAAAMAGYG